MKFSILTSKQNLCQKHKLKQMKTNFKKTITFLMVFFFAMASHKIVAQTDPTFDQTVNYIVANTKGRVMYPGALDAYSRVNGYTLKDVKIEKNGKVLFITEQKNGYNDFTISFNVFDLVANTQYPEGVIAKNFLVHFNGLNVSSGYGIVYATQNDALKVARAFRHLRTVCEKPQNDLFSQPVIEEKKILGKEETISYINKNIKTGLRLGECQCHILEIYSGGNGRRGKKNGTANYYVESHELVNATTYNVYAKSDRQDCEETPYFNSRDELVKGSAVSTRVEVKFTFDFSKLSNFEIFNGTNDATKILKLNFQANSSKIENKSRVYLNNIGMWNTNSLQFLVLTENVEKVKKAFMHLEKLIKEENKKAEDDDPFGN